MHFHFHTSLIHFSKYIYIYQRVVALSRQLRVARRNRCRTKTPSGVTPCSSSCVCCLYFVLMLTGAWTHGGYGSATTPAPPTPTPTRSITGVQACYRTTSLCSKAPPNLTKVRWKLWDPRTDCTRTQCIGALTWSGNIQYLQWKKKYIYTPLGVYMSHAPLPKVSKYGLLCTHPDPTLCVFSGQVSRA